MCRIFFGLWLMFRLFIEMCWIVLFGLMMNVVCRVMLVFLLCMLSWLISLFLMLLNE